MRNVMNQRSRRPLDDGRKACRPILKHLCAALVLGLVATQLSACNGGSAATVQRAKFVRTEIVRPWARQGSVTLTGEVQARFRADLSFRISGRVRERLVDVGAHVETGEVLARLDPTEQQADLDAAIATVTSAEAELRVAKATFDRHTHLITMGFTTRVALDEAQERLQTAEGSLEAAKAQLGTAKDILGYTELRAGAAGVITARSLEVGQVVQAAQTVFSLAQDGDRDAVFDFYEAMFFGDLDGSSVSLTLVSDPNVTATGSIREVSPAVDPKHATVRVKVAIQNPPPAMTLGSAVAGTGKWKTIARITVPWTALMAVGSKPAVWVVDPSTKTASLKPVTVAGYEAGAVVIKDGLQAGDRIVVDGGKLLSSGQSVTYAEDPS
jgi:membrane fusion protein, multidrug efflux system